METYNGLVRTPADAIVLFEACRVGMLPRVQRRLSEKERQQIKSGSVFVWDEREAGMRRWTDGKSWSASRVSGSFLTYREMEGKRGGNSFAPTNQPGKKVNGKVEANGRCDSEPEDGPDGYRYKTDGLVKQSFSITTSDGRHLHLISYYARSDVESLIQPTSDSQLRNIRPPKGMYPESTVNETSNVPAVTRGPMPGSPYATSPHQVHPMGSPYARAQAQGYAAYPPGSSWPPSPIPTPPTHHYPPFHHPGPHGYSPLNQYGQAYPPHGYGHQPGPTAFDRPPAMANPGLPPPPPPQANGLSQHASPYAPPPAMARPPPGAVVPGHPGAGIPSNPYAQLDPRLTPHQQPQQHQQQPQAQPHPAPLQHYPVQHQDPHAAYQQQQPQQQPPAERNRTPPKPDSRPFEAHQPTPNGTPPCQGPTNRLPPPGAGAGVTAEPRSGTPTSQQPTKTIPSIDALLTSTSSTAATPAPTSAPAAQQQHGHSPAHMHPGASLSPHPHPHPHHHHHHHQGGHSPNRADFTAAAAVAVAAAAAAAPIEQRAEHAGGGSVSRQGSRSPGHARDIPGDKVEGPGGGQKMGFGEDARAIRQLDRAFAV